MANDLLLFHGNLNVLLHVLYKIINKIYAKVVIAQNDTHLSCIQLDINVSKCFTKAQHFETLISSLILSYYNFCINFICYFDAVFMFVTSLSIIWIKSVSPPGNLDSSKQIKIFRRLNQVAGGAYLEMYVKRKELGLVGGWHKVFSNMIIAVTFRFLRTLSRH